MEDEKSLTLSLVKGLTATRACTGPRALRPVEGIRAETTEITTSEDLARRVPVPAPHDGGAVRVAESRERVFERFVRHGGTLTVRQAATGGALFGLRLPVA